MKEKEGRRKGNGEKKTGRKEDEKSIIQKFKRSNTRIIKGNTKREKRRMQKRGITKEKDKKTEEGKREEESNIVKPRKSKKNTSDRGRKGGNGEFLKDNSRKVRKEKAMR